MGGPFAVEKNLLFRTPSNKKSINLGALPVFDFCHQTYCEKHPYLFPALFCFFLILLACFPDHDFKGGTSPLFHILCGWSLLYIYMPTCL